MLLAEKTNKQKTRYEIMSEKERKEYVSFSSA